MLRFGTSQGYTPCGCGICDATLGSVLRGKAFPLAGTSLPAHPLLRGDPQAVQKLSLMSLGLDLAG